jgi:hypothetical protein
MLNPGIAYDIGSQHRNALLVQAATIARARDARHALHGSSGSSAPTLKSRVRVTLRLRAA